MTHAFISSRIDYCNSIIDNLPTTHIRPLRSVLNAAARVISRRRKYSHISDVIRDELHWLPASRRPEYKMCIFVYKCLHQAAPAYLVDMVNRVSSNAKRQHLRSAAHGDLNIPRVRTVKYGQRSFAVSGPSLWNLLPLTVRDPALSINQFCARLKTELFTRAYGTSS